MWLDTKVDKSDFKRRSCKTKKRFREVSEAKKAVFLIRQANKSMYYYKCDICNGFHLASKGE